jgi:hypothetical protein
VAKAEISIPWLPWLPMRVVVDHVARHLSCTPEDAWLRIVQAGEARRIKACSLTVEGWPVSLLPAAWRGIDGDADVDLRLDALIAAGLLPAPAEPVRWSAQEAIAYIIEGMPLEGKEWTAEMVRQTERGEIALGGVIGADQVPAWGRRSRFKPLERIPYGDFRAEMVERKVAPISAVEVVVRVDGSLGVSPAHRLADYRGPPWSAIECAAAELRRARPEPLRVECRMLRKAEQLYAESGSEPAAHAEESALEPAPAAGVALPGALIPGGRPTDRERIVEEARRRLSAKENVPDRLAPFCRDLRNWLKAQPNPKLNSKTNEVMSVDTIEGHVRDMFREFQRRQENR